VTSHSLTLTGLSRKTVYYFRVSSKDGAENTATSPVPPATNSFKTNPGGGVLSLQASKGSIKLQWAPITDPDVQSVLIYRSTTSYPEPMGIPLVTLPPSATSYRDTAVTPGTTYYYTVLTRDAAGDLSDPAHISFTAPTAPRVTVSLTRTLSTPMRGAEVKALQQFLISQGLLEQGSDSGYFGIKTYAAVKQFQCQQNIVCSGTSKLTEWGMVGPRTRQRINELGQGISPSPLPSPSGPDLSTVQILQSQLALLLQQLAVLQER
jgi:hypothetical protein